MEIITLMLFVVCQGKHPLFLGLTMGTTVVGAVDQIRDLAPIANKYDMWIHVDVSYHSTAPFYCLESSPY